MTHARAFTAVVSCLILVAIGTDVPLAPNTPVNVPDYVPGDQLVWEVDASGYFALHLDFVGQDFEGAMLFNKDIPATPTSRMESIAFEKSTTVAFLRSACLGELSGSYEASTAHAAFQPASDATSSNTTISFIATLLVPETIELSQKNDGDAVTISTQVPDCLGSWSIEIQPSSEWNEESLVWTFAPFNSDLPWSDFDIVSFWKFEPASEDDESEATCSSAERWIEGDEGVGQVTSAHGVALGLKKAGSSQKTHPSCSMIDVSVELQARSVYSPSPSRPSVGGPAMVVIGVVIGLYVLFSALYALRSPYVPNIQPGFVYRPLKDRSGGDGDEKGGDSGDSREYIPPAVSYNPPAEDVAPPPAYPQL